MQKKKTDNWRAQSKLFEINKCHSENHLRVSILQDYYNYLKCKHFNLTIEPINKAERVVPFCVSWKELTKQKLIVNHVTSTMNKKKFLSKKLNNQAKKALENNGSGSYPLIFHTN